MNGRGFPLLEIFNADHAGAVWRIPSAERAKPARDWARQTGPQPASVSSTCVTPLPIDRVPRQAEDQSVNR